LPRRNPWKDGGKQILLLLCERCSDTGSCSPLYCSLLPTAEQTCGLGLAFLRWPSPVPRVRLVSLRPVGKFVYFLRFPIPNPLQILSLLITGPFPDWSKIGGFVLICFDWRGHRHANAVPIYDNPLPIPCQLSIKFRLAEKNQSRNIDFKSLPSEGQYSANPAGFTKSTFNNILLPMECQSSTN